MLAAISKNRPIYYIHSLIMLVIMFGFRAIPPPEPITPVGMQVLGVFLGMLYGWLIVNDLVWPSILGLVALGMCEGFTTLGTFKDAFGNSTVLMLIFFCAVTSIINSAGIAEYLARRIVSVKVTQGRPYVLSFMLCLAMIVLATMLSMTAACLIAFPLVKEVAKLYGFKPQDLWPILMTVGVHYIGSMAYMLLPYKSIPAVVFGTYYSLGGAPINYAGYVACVSFHSILAIIAMLAFYKFVVKPDVSLIVGRKIDMKVGTQLTTYQKMVFYSFCGVIVALLLPNVLPKAWAVSKFLNALGTNGILLLYIVVYLFFSFKQGIGFKEIMTRDLAWPAIYLIIAVLAVTSTFDKYGVTGWLAKFSGPLLSGQGSYIFMISLMVMITFITNFTNNIATAAMITPLAYTLGSQVLGSASLEPMLVCVVLTATLGMVTPPASVTAAYIFGDKEWMPTAKVMKYSLYLCIINVIILYVFTYNLAKILL